MTVYTIKAFNKDIKPKRKFCRHCFHSLWLWLLITFMQRRAEQCALHLYCASLSSMSNLYNCDRYRQEPNKTKRIKPGIRKQMDVSRTYMLC